jgi:hypothetical protein
LRTLEAQHFEEPTVVVHRHSPFSVVISKVQRVRRAPCAAQLAVGMTLRSQSPPVVARHESRTDSAVQPHGVTILVNQLDAVDTARAARSAANFVHQFEQHPRIQLGGRAEARLHSEMQNCESLMC